MLDPLLIVELGVLGLCTGFLAGLLGIGGGMLLVPFLTYILGAKQVGPDLAVKMAIATSMATIVFTSISSVRAHHKRAAVRWDIVTKLAPGIVLGSFAASLDHTVWFHRPVKVDEWHLFDFSCHRYKRSSGNGSPWSSKKDW